MSEVIKFGEATTVEGSPASEIEYQKSRLRIVGYRAGLNDFGRLEVRAKTGNIVATLPVIAGMFVMDAEVNALVWRAPTERLVSDRPRRVRVAR